jgi:chromosome segregation ATPase
VHQRERARASQEHTSALANQRKELALAAEQAENRLMVLLDQERQSAKASVAELGTELRMVRDQLQSSRETAIALEARIRQREEENGKLALAVSQESARCSELSSALGQQQQLTTKIRGEFADYKKAYKLSGDLGALQAAVTELQAKLQERKDE